MIKKTTTATFDDGDYAGEYDWQGGIPLSVGEIITVVHGQSGELVYELVTKFTSLHDTDGVQLVKTNYRFKLAG